MNAIGSILAVAMSVVALTAPLVAQAQTQKLKFSSFEPPTAALTSRVMAPWAEEVSKSSRGQLQIDMYAGGALGKNPLQQLKLVQDGVADIAWIIPGYTPGRFEDTDVVALPFATENATEASVALWRMFARGELGGFDDLKVLALAATPPVKIHATVPIRGVGDVKGKKVRATGDVLVRAVERLGGVPVTLGGGQVAEALSRGVVDVTLNNWGFVADFKVNEVASHHLSVPMGNVAVMIAMRKSSFDQLPADARTAIEKSSGEVLSQKLGREFDRIESEYAERVAKSGKNSVVEPTAAEREAWKSAVEPVIVDWRKARTKNEELLRSFTSELGKVRSNQ
jgi:TRAP-type C4-dicarboxylate transport system substrate-binding protein